MSTRDGDLFVRTFEGYRPNRTLRELADDPGPLNAELDRTAAEEAATACMPGDDPTGHPLYTPSNPFLFYPDRELAAMLEDSTRTEEDRRLIRAAISMRDLQHTDGVPRVRV